MSVPSRRKQKRKRRLIAQMVEECKREIVSNSIVNYDGNEFLRMGIDRDWTHWRRDGSVPALEFKGKNIRAAVRRYRGYRIVCTKTTPTGVQV